MPRKIISATQFEVLFSRNHKAAVQAAQEFNGQLIIVRQENSTFFRVRFQ
ncbi:hypothetical protein RIF25_13055 [Thermosynechococcaceae cyanobacterium BACA0444]|uniref:Uncharacterized protein n=1 Tax=Pseudocalidococcus azoricus BACA0444 TaxID=2918990 RepID=A0AAE4K099_9CYAN|nr:hypothetical protein [Pseudocalidococcus azoricus]MDS3861732.1 hypothetical protein [Pseudocalidococcus azoricus BACA0444]